MSSAKEREALEKVLELAYKMPLENSPRQRDIIVGGIIAAVVLLVTEVGELIIFI